MTIWIGCLLTRPGKGWLVNSMVSELSWSKQTGKRHGGICWLCTATLQDMRSKGPTFGPLAFSCSGGNLALGKPVSNLLAAPTLPVHQFRPDWLRSMGEGVTADFFENFLLWTLLPKMAGCNHGEKIKSCLSS